MTAASLVSLLLALLWGGLGLVWLLRRSPAARRAAAPVLLVAGLLLAPHVVSKPGGTNDPPVRGSVPARTIPAGELPAWFLALGYNPADADASGIPDCWERWTHTCGMAASADPDGDGLSNLDEFLAQTDPLRADTDGDGLSDADELAGLSSGAPDLDPLVPATFLADEPDTDENGIPDLWEDAGLPNYWGVDAQGFPEWLAIPPESATNADAIVRIDSSRSAALSWGEGLDETILLPPCTNLALRIRLPIGESRAIRLSPGPAVGPWKAALRAEGDPRRGLSVEGNRIGLPDGGVLDLVPRESRYVGVLRPALRSGASGEPDVPAILALPRGVGLNGNAYCLRHGPGLTVSVTETNAPPPYGWSINWNMFDSNSATESATSYDSDGSCFVRCWWKDGHTNVLVRAERLFLPAGCHPPVTNLVGAITLSSHDPDDPSDHLPRREETVETFGPNCPPATNVTAVLGYGHEPPVLSRNLPLVRTGYPADDQTDHCIGLLWSPGMVIDLNEILAPECAEFAGELSFLVLGASPVNGGVWEVPEPDDLEPTILHAEVLNRNTLETLDRIWIVVNAPETKRLFDEWVISNSLDRAWTLSLPPSPDRLASDNAGGFVLPPGCEANWYPPEELSPVSYLHHDAVFEVRSRPVCGEYGHQATYRADGTLITNTIAAGTADRRSPSFLTGLMAPRKHRNKDVYPYIRALQLDGNPVLPCNEADCLNESIPYCLSRPALRQGTNVEQYLSCRPVLPTGILQTP